MLKTLNKLGIDGMYLKIVKLFMTNPQPISYCMVKTGSILFVNWHKTRKPSLTTPSQHSIGISSQYSQERKRNKGYSIRKRGSEIVSIYRGRDCIFRRPHSLSPKSFLADNFSKVAGYKINVQKSQEFLYTNNRQTESQIISELPFIIATKRIKYLGIQLTRDMKNLFKENYKPHSSRK